MAAMTLKAGREKSVLRRHPWIFSGAVANIKGTPEAGATIDIYSNQDAWLARAAYSPQSQIIGRIWTFEQAEEVSAAFFHARLKQVLVARQRLAAQNVTAYRVVNAESDGLPGVIIDRYGDFFVCQFLTAGADAWKAVIVAELAALAPHAGIYERSDADVREKEGLPLVSGVLSGETPPDVLEIQEGGMRFLVDIQRGQKTGFYLDQRDNRAFLAQFAPGAEVLNCFAYTGGFGVYALKHGAKKVTNIETSADALDLAKKNVLLNGMNPDLAESVQDDVFKALRVYRNAERQFDVVVLDPPKFAESKSQLERACRGYKDINWLAMRALRPGGALLTFSCSGLMTLDLFQKIVADAALDAHRHAQMIHILTQAEDHPVALNFPEGAYLKGLVCRVW